MKKRITWFLTIAILVVTILPGAAFAGVDKELENALNIVKGKIEIPPSLTEFNYQISTEKSKRVWYLNWNSKTGKNESLNVSVDELGNILNYGHYKPMDYSKKKLPKTSSQLALSTAEGFLQKVRPDIFPQLKLIPNNQSPALNYEYSFQYIQIVNGIPFPDNTIFISVNSETNSVQNFNCNWTDSLTFPDATKVISMEAAQKAYQDKLGLRLQYSSYFDGETMKIFTAYMPDYYNGTYLDAITGEKVQLSPNYFGAGYGGSESMAKSAMQDTRSGPQALSPQELKAIADVSKIISQDQAETTIRNLKVLEMDTSFKMTNANLSRDWTFKQNYMWNVGFAKKSVDKDSQQESVHATVDAITGEILSFYRNYPYNEGGIAQFDEAASKKAVESFLKEIKPDKFDDLVYSENNQEYPMPFNSTEKQRQYSFNYTRLVNGIKFPGNSISVGYDAVQGKINNLSMNWYKISFPSIDKAIPLQIIYEKMFSDIGLELQYKLNYSIDMLSSKIMPYPSPDAAAEAKLVYAVKAIKPLSFDANTGVIIDSTGQPYKDSIFQPYIDIKNSYAQNQILTLSQFGISLPGTEFKPNENILQKDFLLLLSKTMNYYRPVTSTENAKEIDALYEYLVREGVVKDGEKAPNEITTRETAIKFVVRALKYEKVAAIQGIFKTSFKDADAISKDLYGYVCIAQGLKITNGYNGYFYPKARLTREDAAVLIYNYLNQ